MNIRFFSTAVFLLLFPLVAHASVAGDVEYLSGEAWIERSGEKISLNVGDTVDAGDVVVTTQSGRVKLVMKDDSKVYVGRQSRITIDSYEMRGGSLFSGSFNMLWGKVRFLVTKLKTGSGSFDVHTKTATIGVRGTQFAVMLDKPKKPQQLVPTSVMLFEGAVVSRSIKGKVTNIKPGSFVKLNPNGVVQVRKIEKRDIKTLDIEPIALKKGPGKAAEVTRGKPAKREVLTKGIPAKHEGLKVGEPTKKTVKRTVLPTRLEPVKRTLTPTKLEPITTKVPTTIEPVRTTVTPLPTKIDPVLVPKTDPVIAPKIEPIIAPKTDPVIAPKIEPIIAPKIEPIIAPKIEPIIAPKIEPIIAPKIEPIIAPKIEPIIAPTTIISPTKVYVAPTTTLKTLP